MQGTTLGLEEHLFSPILTESEEDVTTLAPDSYYTNLASHYINGAVGQTPSIISWLGAQNITDNVQSPEFKARMKGDELGNAVGFSIQAWLESLNNQPLPNLSLDGDRGIGWPCNEITGFDENRVTVQALV